MEINTPETLEEYYKRGEKMVQSAAKDTEKDGKLHCERLYQYTRSIE